MINFLKKLFGTYKAEEPKKEAEAPYKVEAPKAPEPVGIVIFP